MWLVVGTKTNYIAKPHGLRVMKNCPQCTRMMEFFEVVPKNYLTVFWVPLVPTGSDESVLECRGCHNRYRMSSSDKIAATLDTSRPEDSPPDLTEKVIVSCPRCSGHTRIPCTTQRIRVTCPSCKAQFPALNGIVIS